MEGIFPGRWKEVRLALILKEKGDHELPSAYRQLCMHDSLKRSAGDLSKSQFRFILGKFRADAVMVWMLFIESRLPATEFDA